MFTKYAPGVWFSLASKLGICSFLAILLGWNTVSVPVSAAPARAARSSSSSADKLIHSPTDNYIAGMEYADFWQGQRMPLKVFIHPSADAPFFDTRYVEEFKHASQSWSLATDQMVRFEFIDDESKSDIDVRWTADTAAWKSKPNGNELGLCSPTMLMNEGISHASIYLLTQNKQKRVGLKTMLWVSLHELGHALGLGHSERHTDIMTRTVETMQTEENGEKTLEACVAEVKLSPRDVTTIRLVYSAKQRLDKIRQKRLDKEGACVELCNEAARQINVGDSGQAIVFLREVLNLDSSYKVALQNLMAAYFNCGAELYNKQHFTEALPVLNLSLDLAKKVGTPGELNQMSFSAKKLPCRHRTREAKLAHCHERQPIWVRRSRSYARCALGSLDSSF